MTGNTNQLPATIEVAGAGNHLDTAELGARIRMRVQAAEIHAKRALEYALEIGALLNEAKPQFKHGEWGQWLAAHCDLAQRTANAYMRLAKAYPTLPDEEQQRVANLPVRDAVAAISTVALPPTQRTAPAVPPRARDDRDRLEAVFRGASNKLNKAVRCISFGTSIKGSDVAALRKQLETVLQQLTALQQNEGGAQ